MLGREFKTLLLSALLPLASFGQWFMDFDDDFASASSVAFNPLSLIPSAWYKGNDSAVDSSGNSLDMTWNGLQSYASGVNGNAFVCRPSTTSYLYRTYANYASGTNPITICARVKFNSFPANFPGIFSHTDNLWLLTTVGNKARFYRNRGVFDYVESGVLSTNTWYFLAGRYGNGTNTLFVDSVKYNGASVGSWNIYTGDLSIGRYGPFIADAIIDDVMLFNSYISDDDITKIQNWRQ